MTENKTDPDFPYAVAIPVGLLLMIFAGWSLWTEITSVFKLPDMAGHEMQYLIMDLLYLTMAVVGYWTAAFGFQALRERLKHHNGESSPREPHRLAFPLLMVAVALLVLAAAIAIYVLLILS